MKYHLSDLVRGLRRVIVADCLELPVRLEIVPFVNEMGAEKSSPEKLLRLYPLLDFVNDTLQLTAWCRSVGVGMMAGFG